MSLQPTDVLSRFDELLRKLAEETLLTLERHEKRVYSGGIPNEFITEYTDTFNEAEQISLEYGFSEGVMHLFQNWYPMLQCAFLSIEQSRKARVGKFFQLQIEQLLTLAQIPYHRQKKRYCTDLILPNLETHQLNRTISAIISVKRTLRERWAEVAEELFNLRTPNVFLFTADEKVTPAHVKTICGQYNIHLVVWDAVKTGRFQHSPMVMGYTEWASRRLPMLRQFWPEHAD